MRAGKGSIAEKALQSILIFFVILMIFSSYSNTFTSPPYLDDFHSFIYEKDLYLSSVSFSSILPLAHSKFGVGRFLPMVSLALNHSLGHSKIVYFHAVNLSIHVLAFLAVFWFVRQVLAARKKRDAEAPIRENAGIFALCVAAIWALSPVQTSAVTYLVQRMASMQALFFTLSTACFIKARILSGKRSWNAFVFYFFCMLSAACSFLSKENSAVLPVALVLVDIWFFDSAWLKKARAACKRTGWKLRTVATLALLSSAFYGFTVVLPKILSGYATRDFNLVQRLLTEGRIVVWYMSLLLWPVPARLSMDHDFQISTSFISPFTTIPALLVIGSLILLAIMFRRRFPVVTFGIVWFFLNLVIESTIIPLELVFEHRLYLPSMGFYLSVAALFVILFRRAASRLSEAEFAKAACSLLLIGAACLALFTFIRNEVWDSKLTLHHDCVTKAPYSVRANADFANTLCEAGLNEEALKYAEKAIELGRKGREFDGLAQNALTVALTNLGKVSEAIDRGQEFLKEKGRKVEISSTPHLCLNLARACVMENRPEEAYKLALDALEYAQMGFDTQYAKSLVETTLLAIFSRFSPREVDPNATVPPDQGDLPPTLRAAMVFREHGEEQYAHEIIEREYLKAPGDPHLSAAFADLQKEDAQNRAQKEKWNSFQKYVQNPFSRFTFDMAVAYLVQLKQLPKVFQDLGESRLDAALKISPGSRDARLLKGWYFYNKNDANHAVEEAWKALEGDSENSNTWLALGFFLARAGDTEGAVSAFKKVIELYPGYPKKSIVEQICAQLKEGKPIESASNRR